MTRKPDQYGRVGVLMGGCSSEAEISMKSGKAIAKALKDYGCMVEEVILGEEDYSLLKSAIKRSGIEIAFIALHGRIGEDGTIQSVLEELSLPYTGSDVQASRVSFNKILTQKILRAYGVNVPAHVILTQEDKNSKEILKEFFKGKPFVVKPAEEGSSVGVTIVKDFSLVERALKNAFDYGAEIICEQYVAGREMTVGILGRDALPVIEILPQSEFFDFHAKYRSADTGYVIPASIDDKIAQQLQKDALEVFNILGCRHLARVDFIYSEEERKSYVLEINTIPGFTSTSLLPKAAKFVGIDFTHLCLKILDLAYVKKEKKQRAVIS